jgi:GntR family transcriptional regulator
MSERLPLTKYHQIYLVLREQLQEGRFADGLPAEMVLVEQFGVGRVTVRKALEQLVQEGLIVRVAGRGTFPTARASQPAGAVTGRVRPTRLAGLMENIVSASRTTTVKVLDWRVVGASATVAEQLQLPLGSKVRKAVRRRSSREGPLSYIVTYMPEHLVPGLSRRALASTPMLQLLEESGVEMGRTTQTISARQADAVVARELGVAIGTALLFVRRLVRDSQDRPVQWLEGLYLPSRYEYQMEVSGVGSVEARIAMKHGHGGPV